jgi:uroporphyrinogen-III synthase/uroporphyrinogen III methyltransferase/synthase
MRAADMPARLDGRRVAVTRGKQGEDALSRRLRELGAQVLELPAIAIVPPADLGPLDAALRRLGEFQWVAFASANAVEQTLARMTALRVPPHALSALQLAAVGPATAERLAQAVRAPDLVPEESRGVALAAALAPRVRGKRVLVPRAEEGRPELVDGLAAAGADVTAPAAYRTAAVPPETLRPLGELLERGEVDALAFASPSAVRSVVAALGPGRLSSTAVAVIGPTTAEAARAAGLRVDIEPRESTGAALAEAIAERIGPRG